MRTRLAAALIAAALIAAAVCAAHAEDKTVVVYSSVDEVFARPVAERFEAQTGIKVLLVPDTEETKSTGLLNRLIAEKARPQADVFWSGDPVRAEVLKARGVSAPYHSKNAAGLPPQYGDLDGYWIGFSARAKVLLYNEKLVAAGEAPHSVFDLTAPKWAGKACIANPLFGTTSMFAAALFEVLGDEQAKSWFAQLTDNKARMLSSNGEVKRTVGAGDCAVGLTDTDDANEAIKDGKPVTMIFPDTGGIGTLVIPNAAVLIAGGPNPDNGKSFIDYLLTSDVEDMLAKSAAQMPLRAGVATPAGVRPISDVEPMRVSYGRLAPRLEELSKGFLKDWVDRQQ